MIRRLVATALWQQRDPIDFLQHLTTEGRTFRRTAWIQRGVTAGCVLVILGVLALLTGHAWREMALQAFLVPVTAQLCCGLMIMVLHYPGFWLLYAHAPVIWSLALVWGLASFCPMWDWMALQLLTPFVLGHLLGDALAVGVYGYAQARRAERERRHGFGVPASLPAVGAWTWIRRVQYGGLAFVLVAALLRPHLVVPGLSCLAGCCFVDATLYALLGDPRPARQDLRTGQWHLTYAGRTVLWVPPATRRALCDVERPVAEGGAWITLAERGFPLTALRRVVRGQTLSQQQRFLLALGLHAGGAEVLRRLLPVLRPSLQALAERYATLVVEAEKPLAWQGWLRALPAEAPAAATSPTECASAIETLVEVRRALLPRSTGSARAQAAMDALYAWLAHQIGDARSLPARCWPAALWHHLEQQARRYSGEAPA